MRLVYRMRELCVFPHSAEISASRFGDELRLRLWTAATNGPIVLPPGDIWAWRIIWSDIDRGKLPILHQSSLAILPADPSSSKQEELAKEMVNFASRSISFILRRVLYHTVKYYDMGPMALLPFRRKACCRFLSLSAGFEPANLG
jgi:hypothetical protein